MPNVIHLIRSDLGSVIFGQSGMVHSESNLCLHLSDLLLTISATMEITILKTRTITETIPCKNNSCYEIDI